MSATKPETDRTDTGRMSESPLTTSHTDDSESAETANLFRENELRTNRTAAIALCIIGAVEIGILLFVWLGLIMLGSRSFGILMAVSGILNILLFFWAWRNKYAARGTADLILTAILFCSGVLFFYVPLNAVFLLYGPMIISAMYYNAKRIKWVAAITAVLFTVLLWANVVLEAVSEPMRAFHRLQGIGLWTDPIEVLLYRYIPHMIFLFVTALICYAIAQKGRSLVRRQAEVTAKAGAMEAELQAAAQIQMASLPPAEFESDRGIRIEGRIRAAKVAGGDFYDYFESGPDLFLLVADVSDKGMPAAMFMMKAKNILRSSLRDDRTLEDAVAEANRRICENNPDCMFVTLWILRINEKTGAGQYLSCGHAAPMLRRADGSVVCLESKPHLPLGLFPGANYASDRITIRPFERLAVYTDGLTDAENETGDRFGTERLLDAFRALSPEDPSPCDTIFAVIDRFASDVRQFDDMTLLLLDKRDVAAETQLLRVKAGSGASEPVIEKLNSLLAERNCPETVRRNLDVAVDEICSNIADYAYPDGEGEFEVHFRIGGNEAELTFLDQGIPFDPFALEEEEDEELRIGGLGIPLVKQLTDRAEYRRDGDTNCLCIGKTWGPAASEGVDET